MYTFQVILRFEIKKLFVEQLEMVKLFVKQRIHEFILFDENSILCVCYET
jgi:hypothetical protein